MHRRRLATDIAGDEIELVGGYIKSVAGLATLTARVLEHDVFTGCATDIALRHLDIFADTVLLMDDEIAGLQRQWVDDLLAARWHLAHVGSGARTSHNVLLGNNDKIRGSGDEAMCKLTRGHVNGARLRGIVQLLEHSRRHVGIAQCVRQALCGPLTFGDEQHALAQCERCTDVGCRLLGIAAIRLDRPGINHDRVDVGDVVLWFDRERRDLPPAQIPPICNVMEFGEVAVPSSTEIDRRRIAGSRVVPTRFKEFRARCDEIVCARPDALGITHEQERVLRQDIKERLEPIGKQWRQGLHAIRVDALGALLEQIRNLRIRIHQRASTIAH